MARPREVAPLEPAYDWKDAGDFLRRAGGKPAKGPANGWKNSGGKNSDWKAGNCWKDRIYRGGEGQGWLFVGESDFGCSPFHLPQLDTCLGMAGLVLDRLQKVRLAWYLFPTEAKKGTPFGDICQICFGDSSKHVMLSET